MRLARAVAIVVVSSLILSHSLRADDADQAQSLAAARANFQTKIVKDLRDTEAPDKPPTGHFDLIHYPSPAGTLAAYLTRDPLDGKKYPAVIWAHGGFDGISSYFFGDVPQDNEQTPKAFDEAGMVVIIPSWRGTANNPGREEFFYGEVDDLLAAVDYVKTLQYVDPDRVYIVGHSTGGTLALLAAEMNKPVRAVFAFGPVTDVGGYYLGERGTPVPFDPDNVQERWIRSPINFVGALQTPTFCIEGSRSPNADGFKTLQRIANAHSAPLHTCIIPHGTHFTILHSALRVVAAKIADDTGPTCNIQISQSEFSEAFRTFVDAEAKTRTQPLVTITDALSARIAAYANARRIDPSRLYIHVLLSTDDDITAKLTTDIDPDDKISVINSVNVAIGPDAMRFMSPIQIDYSLEQKKMVISHIKKQ